MADGYLRLRDMPRSEQAVLRVTQLIPDASLPWYNLATIQSIRGEIPQALVSLKKSLDLNAKELPKDPKATNLRAHLFEDSNLTSLRQTPEFQAAFGTKP
jgi:hypothetical protein